MQKLLNLMRIPLFICFYFHSFSVTWEADPQKDIAAVYVRLLCLFSSSSLVFFLMWY